jgi:ankyrin repeat protein/ketosteroid isomerase-like protein
MSDQETRQIARQWFDALDRGDIETALSCLADDVEWINLPKIPGVSDIVPWLGTCHGVAEVAESFRIRDAVVEVKVFKPLDLVVQGEQAVGTVRDYALVKSTGQFFDIEFASWFHVRGGKIVKWKSYCDPSPIIAAFRGDFQARLLDAVQHDDLWAVTRLLKQGADPNTREASTGLTVLMFAACHGNADMVRLLLEAGADVFTTDSKTGATALHKACQGGNPEVARLLVEKGAFVDAVTPTMGHTPIMDALWYKWPAMVQFLVDQGANLHLSTHYGFTMMEHFQFELNVNTLGKDKLLAIDAIFKAREKANQDTITRQTVMAAVNGGALDTVKQLLHEGTAVNTTYPIVNSFLDGHTPLLVAARDGHTEIVRDLLQAGAEVRVMDWVFKGAPIHKATYNGNPDILQMLIAHPNIDLDVQGPINGYTPLHDALWHGYTACAEMLIHAGARLDLLGHDGKTPLDVALDVYGPDADIVRLLRSKMPSQ